MCRGQGACSSAASESCSTARAGRRGETGHGTLCKERCHGPQNPGFQGVLHILIFTFCTLQLLLLACCSFQLLGSSHPTEADTCLILSEPGFF